MKRNGLHLAAIAGVAALVSGGYGASPASAQSLGAAQSFAVVGGSAVTAAGTGSVIDGNVGVAPGTSITGFPAGAAIVPPFATHDDDAAAIAAQAAVGALYTTLSTMGGATVIGAELGMTTLGPGVYSLSSADIAAGETLILSGAGTYIFQVGSALTANVLSTVTLQNGATACNVFWQVTSAATLNGAFVGNVVAQAGVSLGPGASLNGRALATTTGPVTLAGGNAITGGCTSGGAPCGTITIAPPTLPAGVVATAYSQQITASGGTAPYTFAVVSGAVPAGLTLTPGGLLSGTPTAPVTPTSTFTIRVTDASACFALISYTMSITTGVPTLPEAFAVLLALGLTGIGYFRLRRRARAE